MTESEIDELQAAAVNDRRHASGTDASHGDDIFTNLALAVSVQDLHESCLSEKKHQTTQKGRIPSQLRFKFQFRPKNPCVYFSMNFSGCLKFWYLAQQKNIRKLSEDDHHCNMLFNFSREIAIRFNEHSTFASTNNKSKIKVREPGYPISTVRRGGNILVAKTYTAQLADHNFSSMTITPTVALISDIPPKVDNSWNRAPHYEFLKITATEPSSTLRNAAE